MKYPKIYYKEIKHFERYPIKHWFFFTTQGLRVTQEYLDFEADVERVPEWGKKIGITKWPEFTEELAWSYEGLSLVARCRSTTMTAKVLDIRKTLRVKS